MYSMILMMAMGVGGETPAFGHGCNGGCYGGYACNGCYGGYSCHGCFGGGWRARRAYGCHGCWSSSCVGCTGGTPPEQIAPPQRKEPTSAPATLEVELPANAELTVDGHATETRSAFRRFTTPPLAPGKEYYYTLEATVMRDVQPMKVSRQVSVRAGQRTRVVLDLPQFNLARR